MNKPKVAVFVLSILLLVVSFYSYYSYSVCNSGWLKDRISMYKDRLIEEVQVMNYNYLYECCMNDSNRTTISVYPWPLALAFKCEEDLECDTRSVIDIKNRFVRKKFIISFRFLNASKGIRGEYQITDFDEDPEDMIFLGFAETPVYLNRIVHLPITLSTSDKTKEGRYNFRFFLCSDGALSCDEDSEELVDSVDWSVIVTELF